MGHLRLNANEPARLMPLVHVCMRGRGFVDFFFPRILDRRYVLIRAVFISEATLSSCPGRLRGAFFFCLVW